MQVFTHSACLLHETGPGHPERAARLRAIIDALEKAHPDLDWQQAPRATRSQLLRVHDERLLAAVLETEVETLFHLDPDTVLGPHSAEAALRAAGAAVAAVDAVMHGARRAFCAVRPPGHHATTTTAMGFCLFNNVAVAAAHALDKHGLERVAIVDFDVHHGNGTQAIFESDPRVLFASSHQRPLYPGTGGVRERGIGNMANAPLAAGADRPRRERPTGSRPRRSGASGTTATSTDAVTCRLLATIKGMRRPIRSLHGPITSWPSAKPSVVAESVTWTCASVMPRSPFSEGNAGR